MEAFDSELWAIQLALGETVKEVNDSQSRE